MYATRGVAGSSMFVRDLRAESRALGLAWESLRDEMDQLERHKGLLMNEWKDLEEEKERLDRDRARFEEAVKQEWFPSTMDDPRVRDRVVRLNVGGQIFEITARLLLQDRFSLLAAACLPETQSILKPDKDGCFFFDRDWFLFRHILTYLQTGNLPRDAFRLRELYNEAGFYCLGSLQRKIQIVLAEMKQPDNFSTKFISQKPTNRNKDTLRDPFGFTSKKLCESVSL